VKPFGKRLRPQAPPRDAALHGAKEFAKIFWKKYTENRRKR
jgi:hypothetical protein